MFLNGEKKKRERIVALDLLRGTFLLVIFINHVAWSPSLFDFITGQSHLFASAAEGFFAISGILLGYIYGPRVLVKTKDTFIRLFKRAGWLYLLSIWFTALYSLLTVFLPPDTVRSQYLSPSFFDFLFSTLTLQLNYGWADFLSRYAVLMIFAPFTIWLIAKNKTGLVAVLSFIVWFMFGDSNIADYAAWQIIFIGGIIIGCYLPRIEASVTSLSRRAQNYGFITLTTVSIVTFIVSIILTVMLPIIAGDYRYLVSPSIHQSILSIIDIRTMLDYSIFDRDSMALGRLVIGTVWFSTLYIWYRKYEKRIDRISKGSLLLLGQNSLYVYGLQSFILFMMDIFLKPPEDASVLLKTLVVANAVYFVYLLTKHRTNIRSMRKQILRL
ncbi:hypothetical protein EON76_01500 [bacterium]|nr:MAG: hypothetical protein EON76_01500 [bacterium]